MAQVTSDVAYDYIRKRILNGDFAIGSALKTNVLSQAIGISRTPIRDALRQLEADGLVEIEPHFGASVKCMSMSEFSELCMMRLALESLLAGIAADLRTESDLREISLALENMRQLVEQPLPPDDETERILHEKLLREDVRFHVGIMTAARKPRIKKEVLRLHLINRVVTWGETAEKVKGVTNRPLRDGDRRFGLKGHDEIYQAILQGQATAAREAMARHIQHIIDVALARLGEIDSKLFKARELTEEEEAYSS